METQPVERMGAVRTASALNLLLGIYLFISPWIYGVSGSSWNSWIVGALIVIFASARMSAPASTSWAGWVNCLLGAWVFASPWIYGFTGNSARYANNLAIGVVVFILALVSATAFPRTTIGQQPMTPHRM